MNRPAVLICVAIQMEADAIARALSLTYDRSRLRATGEAHHCTVTLRIVGMQAVRLREISDDGQFDLMISAGLAGAVDPSLRCGDVVIDAADLPALPATVPGKISHSNAVVATAHQKAEIFREGCAVAVDMETAPLRQFARDKKCRFIAVRAISDQATEAIDPSFLRLVDVFGRPRILSIARTLIFNPLTIRPLLKLRLQSKLALSKLVVVLGDVLEREGLKQPHRDNAEILPELPIVAYEHRP